MVYSLALPEIIAGWRHPVNWPRIRSVALRTGMAKVCGSRQQRPKAAEPSS
jgi:hypothetical protein